MKLQHLCLLASSCFGILSLPGVADTAGMMPGDDNMTCEEIGTELASFAQQMGAAWTPVGQTAQEMKQKSADPGRGSAQSGRAERGCSGRFGRRHRQSCRR